MRRAGTLCFTVAGLFFLATCPAASEQVVFDATPIVRIHSDSEETRREVLTRRERAECRLTITRRDGRYYWTSRKDRELVHYDASPTHYFVANDGGGYVKVVDRLALSGSGPLRGPRFHYMEHVSLVLSTITYWGESDVLSP